VAREFLKWLTLPAKSSWLDVGSGTGALAQVILNVSDPGFVTGIDRSEEYVRFARSRVIDSRAAFEVGDAMRLPVRTDAFDAAISGLALNFVPRPSEMVSEMRRTVREGGTVAAYVWDYAGKMQLLRHFWDVVVSLDPAALELDEGRRFPICEPLLLHNLFQKCDLSNVEAIPIDIETQFRDFDDYWTPFLGGQGPAPSYAMSLPEAARARLRNKLLGALPITTDGSIRLIARAWAVKGIKRVEK
jgi:SAM-dependent methyltransferase